MVLSRRARFFAAFFLASAIAAASPSVAFDGLVVTQTYATPSFTMADGTTVRDVRIGWESYGTLNAARDNAILICPHLFATSHAAGRVRPEDAAPGYWDDLIGPGRAIDTDRYFVVSVTPLAALNALDPRVVTTGPASADPATGRPYGLRFPPVTIRDMVNLQKAVLDQLGIGRVRAVVGASMGALQALDWAAADPDRVGRTVALVGGDVGPFQIALFDRWSAAIRLDPDWKGGDYYGGRRPDAGVTEAITLAALLSRQAGWAEREFPRGPGSPVPQLRAGLANRSAIEQWFDSVIPAAATSVDANHLLYLVHAVKTFAIGDPLGRTETLGMIKAPVLLMPAEGDLLFPPEGVRKLGQRLAAAGVNVRVEEIHGSAGHLDGVSGGTLFGSRLKEFLEGAGQ